MSTLCPLCGNVVRDAAGAGLYYGRIAHGACAIRAFREGEDAPHVDELRERDERGLDRDAERLRDEIEADA